MNGRIHEDSAVCTYYKIKEEYQPIHRKWKKFFQDLNDEQLDEFLSSGKHPDTSTKVLAGILNGIHDELTSICNKKKVQIPKKKQFPDDRRRLSQMIRKTKTLSHR